MIERPKLVWIILIWYLFSTIFTLISFWVVFSGSIPLPSSKINYFNNLSLLDLTFTALIMSLNVCGAVTLFAMKKISVNLLFLALAVSVLVTVFKIFNAGLSSALGGGGLIGMATGYTISLVVCIYALRLRNQGLLS